MKPMLDPERDLAGATPVALARSLLRQSVTWWHSGPSAARESIVGDEVVIQEVPADETGDGVPHLRDGV